MKLLKWVIILGGIYLLWRYYQLRRIELIAAQEPTPEPAVDAETAWGSDAGGGYVVPSTPQAVAPLPVGNPYGSAMRNDYFPHGGFAFAPRPDKLPGVLPTRGRLLTVSSGSSGRRLSVRRPGLFGDR